MKEIRTNQPNLVVNALNSLVNEKGDLEELARKFPYSLPIQSFISGLSKSQNQLTHNKFLKLSAVISPDRTVLYDFIEGNTATTIKSISTESTVIEEKLRVTESVVHVTNEPEIEVFEEQSNDVDLHYTTTFQESEPIKIEVNEPLSTETKLTAEEDLIVDEALLNLDRTTDFSIEVIDNESSFVVAPVFEKQNSEGKREELMKETSIKVEDLKSENDKLVTPIKPVKLDDSLEKELIKVAVDKTIQKEVDELIKEIPLNSKQEKESKVVEPDSFNYWLNPAKSKIESREEKLKKIDSLIEKFIKSEPRIVPKKVEFYSPVNVAKQSVAFNEDLVSEPLASIFEKQGYFDKAIKAYEKLSLKFPEKRAYFAARIEKIGEIIKNIKNTK